MITSRRSFIAGIAAAFAAPAIVKASSLMPVKALEKVRYRTHYDVASDQLITRCDVLYGYLDVRAEWAADAIQLAGITMDEYTRRVVEPMVNRLAEQVADQIMRQGNESVHGLLSKYDDQQGLTVEKIEAGRLYYDKPRRTILQRPSVLLSDLLKERLDAR